MASASATSEREMLADLVLRFTEAFNRDDLDEVMSYFADDAVYEQFEGTVSRGKSEIREAFVPQFRGDFGRIRFQTEDLFVDVAVPAAGRRPPGEARGPSGKALIRWLCTLESAAMSGGWRGLDILHFDSGRLTHKLTYAKAKLPLIEPAAGDGVNAPR
jgi:uncharacterized protein (TIGR02246 family)